MSYMTAHPQIFDFDGDGAAADKNKSPRSSPLLTRERQKFPISGSGGNFDSFV